LLAFYRRPAPEGEEEGDVAETGEQQAADQLVDEQQTSRVKPDAITSLSVIPKKKSLQQHLQEAVAAGLSSEHFRHVEEHSRKTLVAVVAGEEARPVDIASLFQLSEQRTAKQKLVQYSFLFNDLQHGRSMLSFEKEYHPLCVLHTAGLLPELGFTGWNDNAGWDAAVTMHKLCLEELQKRVKQVYMISSLWIKDLVTDLLCIVCPLNCCSKDNRTHDLREHP
jgi:hypothetical protein